MNGGDALSTLKLRGCKEENIMQTIQFETTIENTVISLPETVDLQQLKGQQVKVIVIVDEPKPTYDVAEKLRQFEAIKKERQNLPQIDKNIDIVRLPDEMNDDIF